MVVAMGVSMVMTYSTHAVSANLQLEISGIECDLEAIYGNNDPATVTVPSYCNNAPEPGEEPELPATPVISLTPQTTVKSPTLHSYTALLFGSAPQIPFGNTKPVTPAATLVLPDIHRKDMSLVAKSALDAVIASVVIAVIVVVFVLVLKPWLSKLHRKSS